MSKKRKDVITRDDFYETPVEERVKTQKSQVPEVSDIAESPEEIVVVCNSTLVNLRSFPNKNSDVISVLKAGTKMQVIRKSPSWTEVGALDYSVTGFIMNDYLKKV